MIKYLQHTTSGVAGNGLGTTIKYLRGAAGIGPGTKVKYLRCTTSGAAGIGLGTTAKYRAKCLSVEPELPPCVHTQKSIPAHVPFRFGGSK
jgi:hypothetical protein